MNLKNEKIVKILACFALSCMSFSTTCFAGYPDLKPNSSDAKEPDSSGVIRSHNPVINEWYVEKNPCYTDETRSIIPKGIMVHSTASPGEMPPSWYGPWNKPLSEGGKEVAVHAFVDNEYITQ